MNTSTKRSRALRLYVAAVVAVAGVAVALLPGLALPSDRVALVLLVLLSAFAGARPVRFVGKGNEVTATHSAIICALAILGPLSALLTAAAGLVTTLTFRDQRPKLIRSVFNYAAIVLSTSVASHLFLSLGGVPGDVHTMLFWPLFTATAVYFVVNNGLVSIAVAVERDRRVRKVWGSLTWMAASYLSGVILALGLVAAYDYQGPLGLAFGVPPIWLLLNFYSAYHGKMQEKERRVADAERLNSQLQAKVSELEQAMEEVHELRSLLPICMHCKSIRDDDNTWHQLEAYITKHYDTSFTHSLCDGCRETHYDLPPQETVSREDE